LTKILTPDPLGYSSLQFVDHFYLKGMLPLLFITTEERTAEGSAETAEAGSMTADGTTSKATEGGSRTGSARDKNS
jgi:hypothetical protein